MVKRCCCAGSKIIVASRIFVRPRSADGFTNWEIDATPTFEHDATNHPEEIRGIEDARITFVPELKRYAVVYTAFSHGGPTGFVPAAEELSFF